jgi:hypothetical protein
MGRSSIRVAGVEKNAALVTDWGEEVSRQSRTGELSSLEGVSVNGGADWAKESVEHRRP